MAVEADFQDWPFEKDLYWYRAFVVSVYDGDSITINIDQGFKGWLMDQKTRLYGIDTPELRGEERPDGLKVRDVVRHILPEGSEIRIRSHYDRSGKFGRWLVEVWPRGWSESLNEYLVREGYAKTYMV